MPRVTTTLPTFDPKAAVLFSACLLAVVVAAGFSAGGHINLDEAIYHVMARDFLATGGPRLWNGYAEFPTRELTFPAVRVHDGQLVSQYPQLFAALAAPFYYLLGYDGLFVLNAVAFAGVVWLTFWLARRLFAAPGLALNACLILVFATYAWEYTQATLPHTLSMLWVLGSLCLAVSALKASDARRSLRLALAAGLLAGFGVGVRLDVIFVLPALVAPFFFLDPWKPRHGLAAVLGTMPGLAVMAALNHDKFGIASPFTYGLSEPGKAMSLGSYLALAAVGGLALLAVWLATRPRLRPLIAERRLAVSLVGTGLVALVLLAPHGWALVSRFADGLYQLLIDFRIRDLALGNGGLSRGASGSMIYMGGLKKSLLQSCPYLAALAVPLWAILRRPADRRAIAWLFMVPATYLSIYGYFAWHGGSGLNLRYFLPILPLTSILTAYAWNALATDLAPWVRRALPLVGSAVAALFVLVVLVPDRGIEALEPYLLTAPLLLGGLVFLSAAVALACRAGAARAGRNLFALTMIVAMVWAGMVAFAYDLPKSFQRRYYRDQFTQAVTPHIEPNSIVFTAPNGLLYGQLARGNVRVATPAYDDFHDLAALMRFHLDAARPVYLWLEPRSHPWLQTALERHGLWSRLRYHPVFDHEWGRLIRIDQLLAEAG